MRGRQQRARAPAVRTPVSLVSRRRRLERARGRGALASRAVLKAMARAARAARGRAQARAARAWGVARAEAVHRGTRVPLAPQVVRGRTRARLAAPVSTH